MRFSIFTTIFAAAGAIAAPAALQALGSKASVAPAVAQSLIESLNTVLLHHEKTVNTTLHGMSTSSSQADKNAAAKKVGAQFQAMTIAITTTIGELGNKANHVPTNEVRQAGSAEDLADALKITLTTAARTVNTALAVLGLTPLLAFLTPLTGSLSGLIATLKAVAESLLPLLQTVLGGVVQGLTGLLGGLIL